MKRRKILISLLVIVLIAVVGIGGTLCYFHVDTIKGWFGQDTNTAECYDYAAELKTLQAQIETNNNEISTLQKEINDKQAIINEKQAETNADVAAEIKALEATITVLKSRIATLETENQNLEARILELQNVTSGVGTRSDNLSSGRCSWFQVGNIVVVTIVDMVFDLRNSPKIECFKDLPKNSSRSICFPAVGIKSSSIIQLYFDTENGVIYAWYNDASIEESVYYDAQIIYCVE